MSTIVKTFFEVAKLTGAFSPPRFGHNGYRRDDQNGPEQHTFALPPQFLHWEKRGYHPDTQLTAQPGLFISFAVVAFGKGPSLGPSLSPVLLSPANVRATTGHQSVPGALVTRSLPFQRRTETRRQKKLLNCK